MNALIYHHDESLEYAPDVWKKFVHDGRNGIEVLKAPTKYNQLQSDEEGNRCLSMIREHYKDNPYGFAACATNIIGKMGTNFVDFSLTRPWRDGGRDAIGYYYISVGGNADYPLEIDCALEAKCYAENVRSAYAICNA